MLPYIPFQNEVVQFQRVAPVGDMTEFGVDMNGWVGVLKEVGK